MTRKAQNPGMTEHVLAPSAMPNSTFAASGWLEVVVESRPRMSDDHDDSSADTTPQTFALFPKIFFSTSPAAISGASFRRRRRQAITNGIIHADVVPVLT